MKKISFYTNFSFPKNEYVEGFGYESHEFYTITEDGYNLTTFRIRAKNYSEISNKVVIISPGMYISSNGLTNHRGALRKRRYLVILR